jgi:hypothetical protein
MKQVSDQCVAMVNDGLIVKAEDPFTVVRLHFLLFLPLPSVLRAALECVCTRACWTLLYLLSVSWHITAGLIQSILGQATLSEKKGQMPPAIVYQDKPTLPGAEILIDHFLVKV